MLALLSTHDHKYKCTAWSLAAVWFAPNSAFVLAAERGDLFIQNNDYNEGKSYEY